MQGTKLGTGRWIVLAASALLGIAALSPSAARAFDTGHHSDLTQNALQEEGFGETAIKAVQVENWLVDYYINTPTEKVSANIATVQSDMEKLHFDNLYSTAQVRNCWGHFTRNAHNAIQAAAGQNDTLSGITLLGASLHAVQDFYAHSNWAEKHPRGAGGYRTDTWFSNPPGARVDVFSGYYPEPKPAAGRETHGDYHTGLNHDSYVRPRWDEAYVFAYVASRQWTQAMHAWSDEVNPAFWRSLQTYAVTPDIRTELDRDINASFRITEWVAARGQNGHWKGEGSGSLSDFVPFAAAWVGTKDSVYVESFKTKRGYAPLIEGLLGTDALRKGDLIAPPNGPEPAVPRPQFSETAIVVRTLQVSELPTGVLELKIDPAGKPDFYGRITVANQTFVDAMQLDQPSITPGWTTIRFVHGGASVPITYQLWDEDTVAGVERTDDHCDINPKANQADLQFRLDIATHRLSGDVSGVHDSDGNAVTSEGAKPDKNRARIRFYITARPLVATP